MKPALWLGNAPSPGWAWKVCVTSWTRPAASVVRIVVVTVGPAVGDVVGVERAVDVGVARVQSRFFFPPRHD